MGGTRQIETLTDNKRRTAPALRHVLGKFGGSLGTSGSVAWMFDRKGYLEVLTVQLLCIFPVVCVPPSPMVVIQPD